MTADARTQRLRELAVSFFAGHAWVKKSDVLAVLDTEGDRQELHDIAEGLREKALPEKRLDCRHQYWDLGYCIDCGVHSNDPLYSQQLRERAVSRADTEGDRQEQSIERCSACGTPLNASHVDWDEVIARDDYVDAMERVARIRAEAKKK